MSGDPAEPRRPERRGWERLGGALRGAPRDLWELLLEGGITVDTPAAGAERVLLARTLVQVDGDVVTLWNPAAGGDPGWQQRHAGQVRRRLRRALAALEFGPRLVGAWALAGGTAGLLAAGGAAWLELLQDLRTLLLGPLIGGLLLPLLRWLTLRALTALLRRKLGPLLRSATAD